MCLYIFTHLNECATGAGVCLEATAKDCGRLLTSCAKDLGRLTRDLLGVLLLLPGVVLGAVVVAACALLTAVVKLLIGSAFKIDRSVRQYFATIQRGVDSYQGGAPVALGVPVAQAVERERIPVQVPLGAAPGTPIRIVHPQRGAFTVNAPPGVPPGGTFFAELAPAVGTPVPATPWLQSAADTTCSTCAAEVYCCCLPLYLLTLVFVPLLLALQLVGALLSAVLESAGACCLPPSRLLDDWWPAVKLHVQRFDRVSSGIAFGAPGQWALCVPSEAPRAAAELV